MNALARVQEWFEDAPIRLVPSVRLRVLPRLSIPSPRPQPGWRPWKPVVLPGGLPIFNAFAIVQHPVPSTGTSAADGSATAPAWPAAPTQANLLQMAITFRGNATTAENTFEGTQCSIKGPPITNRTTYHTQSWYQ